MARYIYKTEKHFYDKLYPSNESKNSYNSIYLSIPTDNSYTQFTFNCCEFMLMFNTIIVLLDY